MIEMCSCGQPLHYLNPASQALVEGIVKLLGPTLTIAVPGLGAWKVPRHYIALHGIKALELAVLASRFGWEPVPGEVVGG